MQSRTPIKRISRACLRCRQRKSKCNLDTLGEPGLPPCQSCVRAGADCVLATSKRGGRRIPKRLLDPAVSDSPPQRSPSYSTALGSASNAGVLESFQQPATEQDRFDPNNPTSPANIDETIAATDLHSTSDALNLLSHAAQLEAHGPPGHPFDASPMMSPLQSRRSGVENASNGMLQYPLVDKGLLTVAQVSQLIARFKQHYHPHLPIAPRKCFDPESLQYMAAQEPHLLTAVLTVAARDLPQGQEILRTCSVYMHQLVSELSAGKKCDIEAVEALLLLAEWEPQDSLSEGREVGCGEEDRAAWMHVGLALRIGYFLGLDRTAIKYEDEVKAAHLNRRRVTWAVCYISDRSLSARIGRAFWSRGPVALTGIRNGRRTFDDFPPLQPQSEGETDYASILQANLDLVQLFSNVHDVLYSGMGNSMRLMLAGNYVKYVDDFRSAIVGWKSNWLTLTCPPNIKAALQMSYEYLRLYTNAYAFQATVSRAVAARGQPGMKDEPPHNGVPSLPDARFIYESVDAAKSLISIINCFVDAESCLRYMPLRFSLYCVNSAVFLYKAWSFDVLSSHEKLGIRQMIRDVIRHLQKASVRPNDFTSRYSQLLERLWQRKDGQISNSQNTANAARTSTPANLQPSTGSMAPPPQATPYTTPDEFSWLDLQAVGELVSGQQEAGFGFDGYAQFMAMPGGGWDDLAMMEGGDVNRFF